jgi:hypothetical protein
MLMLPLNPGPRSLVIRVVVILEGHFETFAWAVFAVLARGCGGFGLS